jgi:hypothetical protein
VPPSAIPDTPLFVKTQDFILWLIRHTQRFPKNVRQTYTHKLATVALEFQEALLMGNAERGEGRGRWLVRADGRLLCLRALLRIAFPLQLLGGKQMKYAAERVEKQGPDGPRSPFQEQILS